MLWHPWVCGLNPGLQIPRHENSLCQQLRRRTPKAGQDTAAGKVPDKGARMPPTRAVIWGLAFPIRESSFVRLPGFVAQRTTVVIYELLLEVANPLPRHSPSKYPRTNFDRKLQMPKRSRMSGYKAPGTRAARSSGSIPGRQWLERRRSW